MATRVEPSPVATPAALAEQARAGRVGHTHALGELYRLYGPALFRVAYRLTGSREDAEDVLHDVFVGLPEALERYQERGRLDAWLRRLTARRALMKLRGGRRHVTLQAEHDEGHVPPQRDHDLQVAVNALPVALRSVVVLKEIEGYSHAETAEMLGISVVTSRVRLMRAMARLRRMLGGRQ
ncbi:MAG TPA: sigma-70 family RNA polymerase sigma factor [Gemmatimonadales bacterium]|nr:sigma-70 family RNA polymerase sigma factor [Gemmatimonadales bacterium]